MLENCKSTVCQTWLLDHKKRSAYSEEGIVYRRYSPLNTQKLCTATIDCCCECYDEDNASSVATSIVGEISWMDVVRRVMRMALSRFNGGGLKYNGGEEEEGECGVESGEEGGEQSHAEAAQFRVRSWQRFNTAFFSPLEVAPLLSRGSSSKLTQEGILGSFCWWEGRGKLADVPMPLIGLM